MPDADGAGSESRYGSTGSISGSDGVAEGLNPDGEMDIKTEVCRLHQELMTHRKVLEQYLEIREGLMELLSHREALTQNLDLREGVQEVLGSARILNAIGDRTQEFELSLTGISDNTARHGQAISSLAQQQQRTNATMDAVVRAVKRLDRSRSRRRTAGSSGRSTAGSLAAGGVSSWPGGDETGRSGMTLLTHAYDQADEYDRDEPMDLRHPPPDPGHVLDGAGCPMEHEWEPCGAQWSSASGWQSSPLDVYAENKSRFDGESQWGFVPPQAVHPGWEELHPEVPHRRGWRTRGGSVPAAARHHRRRVEGYGARIANGADSWLGPQRDNGQSREYFPPVASDSTLRSSGQSGDNLTPAQQIANAEIGHCVTGVLAKIEEALHKLDSSPCHDTGGTCGGDGPHYPAGYGDAFPDASRQDDGMRNDRDRGWDERPSTARKHQSARTPRTAGGAVTGTLSDDATPWRHHATSGTSSANAAGHGPERPSSRATTLRA